MRPGSAIMLSAMLLSIAVGASFPAGAASTDRYRDLFRQLEILQAFRKKYPPEIFSYCTRLEGDQSKHLGSCMLRQAGLKRRLFANAKRRLGERSAVERLYRDCHSFYPRQGVSRIGHCVWARIRLDEMLRDDPVEVKIYRFCDAKWRRQGFRAIDNCSLHQAKYYLENGQFRY